jgi:hypothetical protein
MKYQLLRTYPNGHASTNRRLFYYNLDEIPRLRYIYTILPVVFATVALKLVVQECVDRAVPVEQ